ncbi:tyrosine-type recombinase/integrase, partial [Frankia sp. R82]|uniref:tyrosine-type recombinase/integrase n=1 Tax=Frankia sp. R82 TaxID=2950553 RepID=UPI0035AC23FD|nr:hypothetical protein [Frankia sp. R82]
SACARVPSVKSAVSRSAACSADSRADGPLLRQVDRHDRIGGRLGGQSIDRIIKRLAVTAGLDQTLSAHSLRAGAATSAADTGATRAAIAEQGRWNPTSNALDRYTRQTDQWKNHPLAGVAI